MQNIQIFNGPNFVEPSAEVLATLDAAALARLDGVRTAYRNLTAANKAEGDAIQHIKDCIEAAEDAADYRAAHFPPSTPHEEWIINFGSQEAKRKLIEQRQQRK